MNATVRHAASVSHAVKANFYIVDKGDPILGLDLIRALALTLEGDKVVPVRQVSSGSPSVAPTPANASTASTAGPKPTPPTTHDSTTYLDSLRADFPAVFKQELGFAYNFAQCIKVNPGFLPVRQWLL